MWFGGKMLKKIGNFKYPGKRDSDGERMEVDGKIQVQKDRRVMKGRSVSV